MDHNMKKLASQVPGILSEASSHLKKVASENVSLHQRNDALTRELRLHKLAMRMEERNLEPHLTMKQKIAHLQTVPPARLDATEQAIELSAGGYKLGSLQTSSEETQHGGVSSSALDLDNYITSGQALT